MSNRDYKKNLPFRDHSTFLIVAEGEREDAYFNYFNGKKQNFQVELVPRDLNASAPTHFINRFKKYKKEQRWIASEKDKIWFVLDTDEWKRNQIEELISYCKKNNALNIAISNPCFEVWLLYHLLEDLDEIDATKLKSELALQAQKKGIKGYHPTLFYPFFEKAILNAKQKDTNKEHPFPNPKQTKVYQLAEQLLEKLGKK
jgi:hypothetical protein